MSTIDRVSGVGVASSVRLHQVMLAAALVVPSTIFILATWNNNRDLERESRDVIDRTAAIMQEQALNVFETAELAVARANDRIENEDWDAISAPETSAFLRHLKAPLDQLKSIWIAGPDGAIRAGSQQWPPGAIETRRGIEAKIDAVPGLTISSPYNGGLTGQPVFSISLRRTTATGQPDGTVLTALSSAYFTQIFADAAPHLPHISALILAGGTILARDPPAPDLGAAGAGPTLLRIMAVGPPSGVYRASSGSHLEYALRRVGAYPAWVVFAVPREALLQRWYRNILAYAAVAATAALTLLGVSFMALRRAEAEQAALMRAEMEVRQRQVAEQQLRHVQRMDAVGQLTSGVAHDFNNLLTAILGNLELIDRTLPPTPSSDAETRIRRLAQTAMGAVQRGASLTKSLLAFARKQPLEVVRLDVNALLADFLELLSRAAGPNIEVIFSPAPNLPPCMADPAELEAALLNLAINTRDAATRLGHLTLTTFQTMLDETALAANPEARPGRFVAISVADDGPGMTEDVAAKAFEPFFTTKPPGQGTGLGLSQVFGFARQLGGHTTLNTAPGAGTAVTVYLPAANSPTP